MNDKPDPHTTTATAKAPPDPRAGIGATGEQIAVEHLIRLGYQIVDRNFRVRSGEIDIIAHRDSTLVFCEVKTRIAKAGQSGAAWNPLESVHPRKQAKVRALAGRWLCERRDRPRAAELQFDAIGVTLDRNHALLALDHLQAAF